MILKNSALIFTFLLITLTGSSIFSQEIPSNLTEISQDDVFLGVDDKLWGNPSDKAILIQSIDNSLRYLNTPTAMRFYDHYSQQYPQFTRERVIASLTRFKELIRTASTPENLNLAIKNEFTLYRSVGQDQGGTVLFTGYFQPVYPASRTPTHEYRYPLYRRPDNFSEWIKPHPTRVQLEGEDGLLGNDSILSGYELVWLKDRFDAYLVQIQGSAELQLTDGSLLKVGFDGNTDYPYVSISKALVGDGKIPQIEISLPRVIEYFEAHPEELNTYIPLNNRFIFFQETPDQPPTGSIGVPVMSERSIATDKTIFPAGGLAILQTRIPYFLQTGETQLPYVTRYVLDQDTGSAIKGAGRVDLFLGTGVNAGDRAGLIHSTGRLYYLLLKK